MFKIKLTALFLTLSCVSFAQEQVVDKVIGVIGKYPLLLSDLQSTLLEREGQDISAAKCHAFEMLVFQKLLLAQADRDSVTVTDAEVDHELNRRMAHFIQKFGSETKLESFYGKRVNVIKDELRGDVQDQLIVEKMQGKVTGDVKLTPAEVRTFYNSVPQDSLPLIASEVELQQLVKRPAFNAEAKREAKELLESYRQRVVSGQSTMSTLARLYSEDPGSASQGGFYANVARGVMDPNFEAVAFRLKTGEVSQVFETPYGYHFIELVQRKGELLDLRHILISPKMTIEDFFRCKQQLDTLYTRIKNGELTFEEAVKKYSDDADTRQNGGLMVNPQTASTKFDDEILSQMDNKIIAVLNSMQVGDFSRPMEYMTPDGKKGFRIVKLKNRIDPHKANLKDDYQRLNMMATGERRQKLMKEWIRKRSKITYIKLDPEFACKFENNWTISN